MKNKLLQGIILACLLLLSFSIFSIRIKKDDKHSEAYDALQFLGTLYAFPDVDMPADAMGKAYSFFKANFSNANMKMATTADWQSIGPDNVGGRTISIAIDPVDTNIIWLGSASGGLWKSNTGGCGSNAWQYIPTGFPVLGVAAIAINPQNTQEVYIGTGETYDYGTSENGLVIRTTRGSNGIGILKTSDGGNNWTQVLNWNYDQRRTVWDILVNPLNPLSVVAATTEGIYKTTDGGNTWIQTLPYTMVMDIEQDASDTSVFYAGVGNLTSTNKGLYKSTDGGINWTLLTTGLPLNNHNGRISVTTYRNNPNIVMAHITDDFNTVGLYRSINKGASFTTVSTGINIAGVQGWYADGIMMKDNDSSKVFISGQYLFASNTSGSNPQQVTNYNPYSLQTEPWPDIHGIISNPLNPNKIYLLTDAGLYRSNNFGATWFACINGYVVSQFYTGDVSATDSTIAIGGLQDRNTQLYSGSVNWNFYPNGDGTTTAIDKTNDQFQYTSSQFLNIEQSNDGGQSFGNYIFGGSSAAFTAPYVLAPSNQNLMYAGDIYLNRINVTTTAAANFPTPSGEPLLSIAVSHTNDQKVYFTTAPSSSNNAGVFKSSNGGSVIADITQNLPNRYARDIEVNPLNDNIAYVAFSGFGAGHIFRTNNGGAGWIDISTTLPDMPFHSLLINPNDTSVIYAGCDFGVFCSTDGGASWQTLNNGLPDAVMVFDLKYSPSDNSVVAFTHGHGVYKIDLDAVLAGIENQNVISNVKVYPVPAKDFMVAEIYSRINRNISLLMFDANGKACLQKQIELKTGLNKITLNINSLSSGIYYLTTNDKIFTRKLVKM